jgi:hypothetical protein
MKKNLLILAATIVMAATNNSFADTTGLQKIAIAGGIGSIGLAGKWTTDLNQEYSKQKKSPDFKMRAAKAVGAVIMLAGCDILSGDTQDTARNIAKVAAYGISLCAITDTVGDAVRHIPLVGGILTDPIDENGREMKDSGAFARGILLYVPLRALACKYFSNKTI